MKNKKGLSGIIATLLLVGITIVSVTIVWGVVYNMITDKTKGSVCLDVLDKVLINNYYTCYDSPSKELKISVELRDIEIDSAIVIVYGEEKSKTFELPSTTGYSYVKPSGGNYGNSLNLPSKNSAVTYVFATDSAGIEEPSRISISPTIDDYQCEVSDSTNIDLCFS